MQSVWEENFADDPKGVIRLVCTQNFLKNYYFLCPDDTHTYECVSGGIKDVRFSENFAYVLNEWSLTIYLHKIGSHYSKISLRTRYPQRLDNKISSL